MKRLTCEVCGSTDIKKEDNTYVCESCGCKYSIEEVKKLLVEGEITVNENHNYNYNINHSVSGQVEMVAKDNTAEEINGIIRAYDYEVKKARTMNERLKVWIAQYDRFRQGEYTFKNPDLPETWMGLLYLQTMGFTFSREACREFNRFAGSSGEVYISEYFDVEEIGEGFFYTLRIGKSKSEDISSCNFNYDSYDDDEIEYSWYKKPLCSFYSIEEIMAHFTRLQNSTELTEEQKNNLKDYQARYNQLANEIHYTSNERGVRYKERMEEYQQKVDAELQADRQKLQEILETL